MHKKGDGEMEQNIHVLSRQATLPESPRVHQSRRSLNPVLWGFYGGFTA